MEKENDVQHFARIIKDIKFAMHVSDDTVDVSLDSRPMTLQEVEFDGDLWVFAHRNSEMVKQIEKNTHVNLSFANPKSYSFLSAQGTACVKYDKDKEQELWNPMYKAWFPEGLSDPNLCLIKVTVQNADFWESPGTTLVHLFGFAKAMITGEQAEMGRHGHLNLN